jgi:hypothetical protein
VDTWNLFDTYLPTTEAQVPLSSSCPSPIPAPASCVMWRFQVLGAGVAQLMPAYSSLQSPGSPTGPPDCANPYILQNILRQRFGAENISVISDNGGIAMVYQTHKCEELFRRVSVGGQGL